MFRRPARPTTEEESPPKVLEVSRLSDLHAKPPQEKRRQRKLPDLDEEEIRKTLSGRTAKGKKKPGQQRRYPQQKQSAGRHTKPMTQSRIKNISEFYVSQREVSAGMLRDMLHRRAIPWLNTLSEEDRFSSEDEFRENVEAEISRLVGLKFIDDKRFAEMKARSWRSAGRGAKRIAMDLQKKGISKDVIQDAISAADAELVCSSAEQSDMTSVESEFAAAETLTMRKRIGQFRTKPMPTDRAERAKLWRREAGVLARAGFGLDIIRQILDRGPDDDF